MALCTVACHRPDIMRRNHEQVQCLLQKQRNIGSRTQLHHSSAGDDNASFIVNVADQDMLIENDHST